MTTYEEFLESKQKKHVLSGFDVQELDLNKHLFPFQKFIVKRALKAGRYAIFADCGLGKTLMQLEWSHRVVQHTGKPVLILAPLAVTGQTIQEGNKFGIEVMKWLPEFNTMHEVPAGIYITNYEQLENITIIDDFAGIVLDESSILKNFNGATYKLLCDSFLQTPYKLACTATPSPNDAIELTNHSEFLGIMPSSHVLSTYFTHDGGIDMVKWKLKGHAKKHYWAWVSSWAMMLDNPADIGFPMDGYVLPGLNIVERQIKTPQRDNGFLFNEAIISATNFNSELRLTKELRMKEVVDIINSKPGENFIIWIKQNE